MVCQVSHPFHTFTPRHFSWLLSNDLPYSGGGIGGLALAIVLYKYSNSSLCIDLYESTAEFSQVGAGVTIWERTWYIFKLLGLDEDLEDAGVMLPSRSANERSK